MKEYEERIKQIEEMANAKVNELQKKVTQQLNNWNYKKKDLIDFC